MEREHPEERNTLEQQLRRVGLAFRFPQGFRQRNRNPRAVNILDRLDPFRLQHFDISRGLTPERIEKFQHFDADESMVGEQCIVCMNDLDIGTKMVRLDCHVDHCLCKVCADRWFEDHNTCPNCRHAFD